VAVTSPGKSMVAGASKGRGIGRDNFYCNVFFLFAVNFVIFSLRATILINVNLNLNSDNMDIFLNQLSQFYSNNTTTNSPLNYTQCDVFPHKMQIVLSPQSCDVTSPYVFERFGGHSSV